MATSIANQTYEAINASNREIAQSRKAQKKGEALVAEQNANSELGRLTALQMIQRDVIIPADQNDQPEASTSLFTTGTAGKPQLPNPGMNWNAFQGTDGDQVGLIAIIGKVLCLQAKTNSRFWSTLWKQASESMMIQVKMAPIMAAAIQTEYEAQSKATQAQADQSKYDGIINLCMFGGAIMMSGIMEFTDAENPLNKPPKEAGVTDEAEEAENAAANAAKSQVKSTAKNINQTAKQIEDEGESFSSRAWKYWGKIKDRMGVGQKRMTSWMGKGMQAAQAMQMLSAGATGLIDNKYQSQQAGYQKTQGQAQALSKEAEQYSQFYGQDFSREEDLRQGSGQNIDYAMQILKSASDTITQTVTSMFRG